MDKTDDIYQQIHFELHLISFSVLSSVDRLCGTKQARVHVLKLVAPPLTVHGVGSPLDNYGLLDTLDSPIWVFRRELPAFPVYDIW